MNWLTNTVGSGAGDLYYWLGGGAQLQSQSDALTGKLAALNAKDYAPGGQVYNAIAAVSGTDAANAAENQVSQDAAKSASSGSVKSQLVTAGKTGAAAGLQGLASGIQGAVSGVFDTLAKLMPWQGWVALVAVAFLYFGGLKWLKKTLA